MDNEQLRANAGSVWDGGCAFPIGKVHGLHGSHGMSLRDYFAACALPKIMDAFMHGEDGYLFTESAMEELTDCAYQYADAMLVRREK